jgi:hypothetical protein
MDQTQDIREQLDEAAQQVDAYIDGQIEHMRTMNALARRP